MKPIKFLDQCKCGKEFENQKFEIRGITMRQMQTCPDCFQVFMQKQRAEQMQIAEAAWKKICPELYQETVIDRLPCEPEKARKVMEWDFKERGLILFGDTDLGKTRLAWALIRKMMVEHNWNVRTFDSNSFSHCCSDAAYNGILRRWTLEIVAADLLFLDDLGKMAMTDRVESELFGVIEARVAKKRPLLITTNWNSELLVKKFSVGMGEPILRRLRQFCVPVSFTKKPKP